MSSTRGSVFATACLLAGLMAAPWSQARAGSPEGECHPAVPGDAPGPQRGDPDARHGPPGGDWGHGGPESSSRPPPWLRTVALSDPQQDRVFAITHEAAPLMREQFKAVRSAHQALHQASMAPGGDATQLRSLADAVGRADAELALLTAQTDQKLLQVLTSEQQRQLRDCTPHPQH